MNDILKVIERYAARVPYGAAVSYVGVVLVFIVVTLTSIVDVFDRRDAVAEAADTLSRLEGRAPKGGPAGDTTGATGAPQLEGPTVTVAGAALLQRVAGAIVKVGGNIVSSQVELQGPQIKDNFIAVTINCDVEQPALQQLLYNLESGMPFLFVDQLVVQAPAALPGAGGGAAAAGSPGGKMHVLISVSGQWQATK
jgi:general secretion pathway protein M